MVSRNEQGQAITEYVLLLSVVAMMFMIISSGLARIGIAEKMMKPIKVDFAQTYRYGHPKAKGYDDGGPVHHPRVSGGNNFRLFINPTNN